MVTIKKYINKHYNKKYMSYDQFMTVINNIEKYFSKNKQYGNEYTRKKVYKYVSITNDSILLDTENPRDLKYKKIVEEVEKIKPKLMSFFDRIRSTPKITSNESSEPFEKESIHQLDEDNGYQWQTGGFSTIDDKYTKKEKRLEKVYNKLCDVICPPQRSEEWFKQREGCISASDGGTVDGVNPYKTLYEFILEKVNGRPFNANEFCYHGKKLEESATMIYSHRMNVKVREFGLMMHPTISFLGASPDGIASNEKLNGGKSKHIGRMLEIKCPFKRRINQQGCIYGYICPAYYWVQVQLQLECCDLDECDFWQCNIAEYPSREKFIQDTNSEVEYLSKSTGLEKGVLIELLPNSKVGEYNDPTTSIEDRNLIIYDQASFIYPPRTDMSLKEIDSWIAESISNIEFTHPEYTLHKVRYWKLRESKCVTIHRDREWFKKFLVKAEKVWNQITYLRKKSVDMCKVNNLVKKLEKRLYPGYNYKNKSIKASINKEVMSLIDNLCKN